VLDKNEVLAPPFLSFLTVAASYRTRILVWEQVGVGDKVILTASTVSSTTDSDGSVTTEMNPGRPDRKL
jgi:hypothetical protein